MNRIINFFSVVKKHWRRQRFRNENFKLKTEYNMKTKTSIYRRHFAFAYVLLAAVFALFCCPTLKLNELKTSKLAE